MSVPPRSVPRNLHAVHEPPDPALEWQHLRGADFSRLDPSRCVVMVSCSPLEVHGPHLPTVTDNLEAEGLSRRARQILVARGVDVTFIRLPPIYVAADVLPHRGSIMFRSTTVTRVLEDLGRSLCRQGFRDIWVGNFHGGPRHFVPIELAADRVNRRYGGRMVSLFGLLIARLTRGENDLTDVLGALPGMNREWLRGDTHGGVLETSMMLHLLGEHVGEFHHLPQRTLALWLAEQGRPAHGGGGGSKGVRAMLRTLRDKLKYFEDETYSGAPAHGNAELGRAAIDRLAELTADAAQELLAGTLRLEDCRSPLFKYRFLFATPAIGWAFERAIDFKQRVF